MKGKILSVLFSLLLVFGMLMVVACDNGDFPKDPTKDDKGDPKPDIHNTVLDFTTTTEDDVNAALDLW